MKKILALLLSLVLVLTLFVGCGNDKEGQDSDADNQGGSGETEAPGDSDQDSEKSGDVLEIEFFQQKGEEGPQKGYQAIIDKFNEENPDIRIVMNTVPDAPTVLTSRISSGDIPVIFSDFPTQVQFKQKVENGFIQDLSDQEFLSNVNEGSLEMSKHPNGGYYSLPYTRNYMGVYYNIDMFEEHNLSVPTTWDELIEVCETLQEAGITPFGIHGRDPGRVGHFFQAATVAWAPNGVEIIEAAVEGEETLEGNEVFTEVFTKMLKLFEYANDDILALADTAQYENFVNGQYAMTLTGSYARGTLEATNPDIRLGVFPLPNDTIETTNTLSGIDAAISISAQASDEEKEAAYKFLAYLATPESAQTFLGFDGAPSCIDGVENNEEGIATMIDLINSGQTHDWMGSTIENNVTTDLYNVIQGLWSDQNIENALKNMDASIAVTSGR